MPLSSSQLAAVRALLDRLIPADDFPGALGAGTESYVIGQLNGDCVAEAPAFLLGLAQLDAEAEARHGSPSTFATLSATQQDELLRALEQNRPATVWPESVSAPDFFNRIVDLAHEGFYADPANGGNNDAISWKMLGYDPRLPKS
jgi:Gluconate 2-dehydrogenase subunit 3